MTSINKNRKVNEGLNNVVKLAGLVNSELFKNFVAYWSIKKAPSSIATQLIQEIKDSDSTFWLTLIQSNHEFRDEFGDALAEELIKNIEENSLNVV